MAERSHAVQGRATRGTTGTNRLRRVDRWIARHPALRRTADPLVVDLGFGSSGVTTFELAARLRRARPDVDVLGLEIDPDRVARARQQWTGLDPHEAAHVSFARGGFEVPLPSGRRPVVIRAMNVLRQYDEADVFDAWSRMAQRLAVDGVLVEGTCDEIGRVVTWVEVGADADGIAAQPRTFTLSLRLAGLEEPSIAAERLPKALIHRNIPGERIHALMSALDGEWRRAAIVAPFGPVHRWRTALAALSASGWPIQARSRWPLGELTLPWSAVAPAD